MKDSFYIYTNPLFWVTILILGIPQLFVKAWKLSHISEWWFYFFKLNDRLDRDRLEMLVRKNKMIQKSKFNWYTKWMWKVAILKINRILKP